MGIYSGLFILSGAALALEVAMVRLLSVTTWYYLAFFAISTAMLGLTCGAVYVYLYPPPAEPDRLRRTLARSSAAFAGSVVVSLILLCLLPLPLTRSVMTLLAAIITGLVASAPFFFAGIVITIVLTRVPLPVGRLYAADLAGAAAGCVAGLAALETVDTPSAILLCGSVGLVAAVAFLPAGDRRARLAALAGFAALALVGFANTTSVFAIRPLVVKGGVDRPERILIERWNSYSRVVVEPPVVAAPQLWGPSPVLPPFEIEQYDMKIDGAAGTMLRRISSPADLEHLKYDVANIAYFLRSSGSVCIIGVGAGRDVQSALAFGRAPILGVELNPVFVDLLTKDFRDVAGIADRPEVTLVVDEARTYLARNRVSCDLLQMSMIDTWAATGAGAFSLSENGLYTMEAWSLFFRRLSDNGLFTVARFFNPRDLSETARVMSLATAVLLEHGIASPADHLAMVTSGPVSALVLSKRAFSEDEIRALYDNAGRLQYGLAYVPNGENDPLLEAIARSRSLEELHAVIADEPLNLTPPTDNNPYFFNMLRLRHLTRFLDTDPGIVRGNLVATGTLVVLTAALGLLTIALILGPLWLRTRPAGADGPELVGAGVLYFVAVGAGFMFVELAMIQRLSVFLGHPIYAMGVLLATIIAAAGVGSLLSERLPLDRRLPLLSVVAAVLAVAFAFAADAVAVSMEEASLAARIAVTVALVVPPGIVMGLFVPVGLRLTRDAHQGETPWYWALNGVVSVLCSALAVLVAITSGVHANFFVGALAYLATAPALVGLVREHARG